MEINEIKCLYCFDCNSECFSIEDYLSGLHKNHEVKYIRKAYEQLEVSASELIDKIKEATSKLEAANIKLENKKKEVKELGESQKQRIKLAFDQLRVALSSK